MKILKIFVIVLALSMGLDAKLKRGSIIVDARAEALICSILKKLCEASGIASVPNIYFIVDDSMNAFATDEASIYIHTGLIIKLENVAQLLAVIAHELGHINGGHIHQFHSESVGISMASIVGTLLGGAAAIAGAGADGLVAGMLLGQGAAQGEFAKYTMGHELKADAAAFNMMHAAGLSTKGGVEVFKLFEKKMGTEPPYLKTHPSDHDRIRAFENFRTRNPDKEGASIPDNWITEFENVKAIFIANLHVTSDASNRYAEKNSPDAILAQAIILSRRGQHEQAFAKLDTLLTSDSRNPYLYEMYGQFLLESGRNNFKKAIEKLKRAVELAPKALSIRLLYAQALYNNGSDLSTALAELDRITQDDRKNAMAWHLKSGILRKMHRDDEADLAQAEYASLTGDKRLAASRAKRAAKKSKNRRVTEEADSLSKELNDNMVGDD